MWWILFFSISLCAMDRQPTYMQSSPITVSSGSAETDDNEQDILSEVALNSLYRNRSSHIEAKLKPKVKERIKTGDAFQVEVLRQMKSGEDISQQQHDLIRDMLEQVTHEVLEDNQKKIDSKFSKKQSAFIGVACTIVTAITAIVVDATTCKK